MDMKCMDSNSKRFWNPHQNLELDPCKTGWILQLSALPEGQLSLQGCNSFPNKVTLTLCTDSLSLSPVCSHIWHLPALLKPHHGAVLIKREESGSDEIRGKVIFIIWEILFETMSAQPPFASQEQTPSLFPGCAKRYIVYKFLQTCCQTLRQYLTPLILPRLRSRRGCIKKLQREVSEGQKDEHNSQTTGN